MSYQIQEMNIKDYDEVLALWQASEGVRLSKSDARESIARCLEQNPGLSFVVRAGDQIVGAVLCTQDGRQGYLNHLVVDPDHRRQGLGRSLVGRCLYALMRMGIQKCNLFILEENETGMAFWRNVEWAERVDMLMLSPRPVK